MTSIKNLAQAKKQLRSFANPSKAIFLKRFFKTGPGEYAEGDRFLGAMVPQTRKVAKLAYGLSFKEVTQLLKSPIHEERLLALFVLNERSKKNEAEQKRIVALYEKHMKYVNNWDLVDCSAPYLYGGFLLSKSRKRLYTLARSKNLWKRRISIITTFRFIKEDDFKDTLSISKILLSDDHDLIHKAVGWMLREVGNRDRSTEEKFLKRHYKRMPRTMLRYAIERFPEKKRKAYLHGKI